MCLRHRRRAMHLKPRELWQENTGTSAPTGETEFLLPAQGEVRRRCAERAVRSGLCSNTITPAAPRRQAAGGQERSRNSSERTRGLTDERRTPVSTPRQSEACLLLVFRVDMPSARPPAFTGACEPPEGRLLSTRKQPRDPRDGRPPGAGQRARCVLVECQSTRCTAPSCPAALPFAAYCAAVAGLPAS